MKVGMCAICGETLTITEIKKRWYESDLIWAKRVGKIVEQEEIKAYIGHFNFWSKDNIQTFVNLCRDCSLKLANAMAKLKRLEDN